jgi:hypothetical protein
LAPPERPPFRRRLSRSLGLTILLVTAGYCMVRAFAFLANDPASTWRRAGATLALTLCAVAATAMLADTFDLWVRGRRFSDFSVRMTRSLVFVCVLLALTVSLIVGGPGLLIVFSPALIIYLFVARQPDPSRAAAPAAGGRGGAPGPSSRSAPRSRQRRGGRKRK